MASKKARPGKLEYLRKEQGLRQAAGEGVRIEKRGAKKRLAVQVGHGLIHDGERVVGPDGLEKVVHRRERKTDWKPTYQQRAALELYASDPQRYRVKEVLAQAVGARVDAIRAWYLDADFLTWWNAEFMQRIQLHRHEAYSVLSAAMNNPELHAKERILAARIFLETLPMPVRQSPQALRALFERFETLPPGTTVRAAVQDGLGGRAAVEFVRKGIELGVVETAPERADAALTRAATEAVIAASDALHRRQAAEAAASEIEGVDGVHDVREAQQPVESKIVELPRIAPWVHLVADEVGRALPGSPEKPHQPHCPLCGFLMRRWDPFLGVWHCESLAGACKWSGVDREVDWLTWEGGATDGRKLPRGVEQHVVCPKCSVLSWGALGEWCQCCLCGHRWREDGAPRVGRYGPPFTDCKHRRRSELECYPCHRNRMRGVLSGMGPAADERAQRLRALRDLL